MRKIIIIVVAAFVVLMVGCKEEVRLDHIDPNAPAPAHITDVTVQNIPGGAVLKYVIPNDPNMSHIKAVYARRPGAQPHEELASNYRDSLVINGFGTTDQATVALYSVGRNGKLSEPVYVEVNPLVPPVEQIFNDLKLEATNGGIKMFIENKSEADISIHLRKKNEYLGGWDDVRVLYTKSKSIALTQRGLKAKETEFAVYIRDNWGNVSETKIETLTPIYEIEVLKPLDFLKLEGDWYDGAGSNVISNLWDHKFAGYAGDLFVTNKTQGGPLPKPFTVDLTRLVELTRIVTHHRGADGNTYYSYDATSVKRFKLYGTAVTNPNADIKHEDWTLLGEFEGFRPSGLPSPMLSTLEDYQYGCIDGESFDFVDENNKPMRTIPVRYVRWFSLETWSGVTVGDEGEIIIAELDFFGKIIDDLSKPPIEEKN